MLQWNYIFSGICYRIIHLWRICNGYPIVLIQITYIFLFGHCVSRSLTLRVHSTGFRLWTEQRRACRQAAPAPLPRPASSSLRTPHTPCMYVVCRASVSEEIDVYSDIMSDYVGILRSK